MKITFPHLGNTYIAGKALLEELGQEVIPPPRCSNRTLEIGTKYSPEMMCMPFKINIGNYVESIERGADTILITGSCGPCRFGYYSVLERNILKDLGYDVNLIVFDPIGEGINNLKSGLKKGLNIKNIKKIPTVAKLGRTLISKADDLTQLSNIKRAYAEESYKVDNIMEDYYRKAEKTFGAKELLILMEDVKDKLNSLKMDNNRDPIRIGIIGEIYTIIEPFVNFEVEKKLGHMGVIVEKSLTPTKWIEHHVYKFPFGSKEEKRKFHYARPYMKELIGGHCRETLGSAIIYANKGFDGVIQLLPLNCMPEIVAKSILPNIEKDYNIPIMTLVVDEMTGESGYITRLEAFVDLLKRRREEKKYGKLLSWN